MEGEDIGNPAVRLCEVLHNASPCGFNLSKSKWDPYPWISTVETDSPAAQSGVLPGDCVLEVNGEDILGLRVSEVASRVKARGDRATLMLWNPGVDSSCTPETLCCGPMPTNLQRLTTCMTNILAALECPICLDTIPPPAHQCANGHLICVGCRVRSERCPVCRLRFFRGRSLLADQVFDSMIDAFDLRKENETERSRLLLLRVYGPKKKEKKTKPDLKFNLLSPTNKFLTRIMGSGKSSSVENLSARDERQTLSVSDEFSQGLKAKSLSSSEIFQAESQPVSRASSILSSRPGSGLLEVGDPSFGPRPASYHGSAGDLQTRLLDDFGIQMEVPRYESIGCPMAPDCNIRVPAAQLKHHLKYDHEGPLIQFTKPQATVQGSWMCASAILAIECFNTNFFLSTVDSQKLMIWTLHNNSSDHVVTIETGQESFQAMAISLFERKDKDNSSNEIQLCNIETKEIKVSIQKVDKFT